MMMNARRPPPPAPGGPPPTAGDDYTTEDIYDEHGFDSDEFSDQEDYENPEHGEMVENTNYQGDSSDNEDYLEPDGDGTGPQGVPRPPGAGGAPPPRPPRGDNKQPARPSPNKRPAGRAPPPQGVARPPPPPPSGVVEEETYEDPHDEKPPERPTARAPPAVPAPRGGEARPAPPPMRGGGAQEEETYEIPTLEAEEEYEIPNEHEISRPPQPQSIRKISAPNKSHVPPPPPPPHGPQNKSFLHQAAAQAAAKISQEPEETYEAVDQESGDIYAEAEEGACVPPAPRSQRGPPLPPLPSASKTLPPPPIPQQEETYECTEYYEEEPSCNKQRKNSVPPIPQLPPQPSPEQQDELYEPLPDDIPEQNSLLSQIQQRQQQLRPKESLPDVPPPRQGAKHLNKDGPIGGVAILDINTRRLKEAKLRKAMPNFNKPQQEQTSPTQGIDPSTLSIKDRMKLMAGHLQSGDKPSPPKPAFSANKIVVNGNTQSNTGESRVSTSSTGSATSGNSGDGTFAPDPPPKRFTPEESKPPAPVPSPRGALPPPPTLKQPSPPESPTSPTARRGPLPAPPPVNQEEDELSKQMWYFGDAARTVADSSVKAVGTPGSFLVRKSNRGGTDQPYTLVVWYNNKVFNLPIRVRTDKKYALGKYKEFEQTFKTVPEMIDYHMKSVEIMLAGDNGGHTKLTVPCRKK